MFHGMQLRLGVVEGRCQSANFKSSFSFSVSSGAAEIADVAKRIGYSTEEVDRKDGKQHFRIAVLSISFLVYPLHHVWY